MRVVIEAINAPAVWQYGGETFKLRIHALSDFTTAGGQFVPRGNGQSSSAYLEVDCTVTAEVPLIPSLEVDSTEDALVNPNARYSAYLITSKGKKIPFLINFAIPAIANLTWTQIQIHNASARLQVEVPRTLTLAQFQDYVDIAVGALNKSSSTMVGNTALSVDPIDPTWPIAVGDNDPRLDAATSTTSGLMRLSLPPVNAADPIAVGDNDSRIGYLTPQRFAPVGAIIGDGTARALSTVYGSLGAAQAVYSFVTSLTQTLDYAAIQKMSYEALGYPTVEHADTNAKLNKPMFIPAGRYQLGADTWLIKNASGVTITGAGRRATQIFSSGIVLQTDGLWYSQLTGLDFQGTAAAIAVVDIDGNVPAHAYATRGVQGNTFKDCFVYGLTTYGLAMTRQGSAGGQGSENLYLNCHFSGATEACYYQLGANALQNTFIGGNFQSYPKNGIYTQGGDVRVFSVGFQSTYGYTQVVNDGWDINTGNFGVGERVVVIGCRTESLKFFKGSGSQPPVLIGNNQNFGGDVGWNATTPYTLNQLSIQPSVSEGVKLYRITTAGTSGGVEPTWPNTGTVADGSAVWTMLDYLAVDTTTGVTFINNALTAGGRVKVGGWNDFGVITNTATALTVRDYLTPHRVIFTDTASGNQIITLVINLPLGAAPPDGTTVTIKKVTTDANTVTLAYSGGNGGEAAVIPGGSTGYVTLQYSQSAGVTSKWWIISKSF